MEFKRKRYVEKLVAKEHNGFIKIITGLRRCGKTYLLFNLFYNRLLEDGVPEDHIICFSFDANEDLKLIGESHSKMAKEHRKADSDRFDDYIFSKIKDKAPYFLLLDEIQELEDFEYVLNGFLRRENLDVYVTGSNSKFLSTDIITEFRGRGDVIHVMPLAFSEFVEAYDSVSEAWGDYILYGGLPQIVDKDTPEEKIEYLSDLYNNIYLVDVYERREIRNPNGFNELIDVLASSEGSLVSPLKLSRTYKSVKCKTLTDVTISNYIGYLEDAFLVKSARRYDVKGKKYIGSPFKIYFEDVGLRNIKIGFTQVEENHTIETIVFNELRYRGYHVAVGVVDVQEKNKEGKLTHKKYEVDFVATYGSQKHYIQVAPRLENALRDRQETASLRHISISDAFDRIFILGEDMLPRRDENGFAYIGIRQFLLDENFL